MIQKYPPIEKSLEFIIPVAPKSVQHGVRWRKGASKPYNDPQKVAFIDAIKAECQHLVPEEPWDGPLGIELDFHLPNEKALQEVLLAWKTNGTDLDNLCKGSVDPLAKAGFVTNDSRFAYARLTKVFATEDTFPRIEVRLLKFRSDKLP